MLFSDEDTGMLEDTDRRHSSVASSAVFYSNSNAILVPRWRQPMGKRVRSSTTTYTPLLALSSSHLVCAPPPPSPDRSQSLSEHRVPWINLVYVRFSRYTIPSSFIDRRGDRFISPRAGCPEHPELNHSSRRQFLPISQDDPERKIRPGGGRVRCSGDDRRGSPT